MSDSWRLGTGGLWTQLGANTATSQKGVTTGSGTANTKGTWSQVGAATTTYPTKFLGIQLGGFGAAGPIFLVDIGVGTTGNEVVIVPNLIGGSQGNQQNTWTYIFPCDIPAGTQINARCQCQNGAQDIGVQVFLGHMGMFPGLVGSFVKDYGTATTNSSATTVTSGTANTKGTYAELVASTTYPIKAIVLAQCFHTTYVTLRLGAVDLAVGAIGVEQIIVPDYQYTMDATSDVRRMPNLFRPIPVNIPAGTRLSMRSQDTSASSATRWAVYGIF